MIDQEKVLKEASEELNEKEKHVVNMSLALDSYNDIFSDFDPRPSSQRSLSVDFLDEAKRAARDKKEELELIILVPKKKRDLEEEKVIKRRLKEHFKKHYESVHRESHKMFYRSLAFVLGGIVLMFFAALFLFKYSDGNFTITFIVILLEPAGWFFFWEGLRQIIFESKNEFPNLGFYKKMSRANIYFRDY